MARRSKWRRVRSYSINPSLRPCVVRTTVGYLARPLLIRTLGVEVLIKPIGCDTEAVARVCCALEALGHFGSPLIDLPGVEA